MCKYALSDGKRVRTILMKQINPDINLDNLLIIEYLHASSLILDDIMDNDTTRRDKECVHIKYGLPMGLMTSVYLVTLALSKANITDKDEIVKTFNELCLGQFMDIDKKYYDVTILYNNDTKNIIDKIKKML